MVVTVVVNCHVHLSCGRRSHMHDSSTPPRFVRSGRRVYESFLVLNWCSCVSSTAPLAFMWMFVFVSLSFSAFVACLAIFQVLCGLTHHVLELHRLHEIRVPLQVFLPLDPPPPDRPKFRAFFPFPAPNVLGSSRGILVVFLKAGALKCARLESSGCRVKPRRPQNRAKWAGQKWSGQNCIGQSRP